MSCSNTVILFVLNRKICITLRTTILDRVYTALKREKKNENQLQVLRDIETHIPKMNEIRQKSYENALIKPKKVR